MPDVPDENTNGESDLPGDSPIEPGAPAPVPEPGPDDVTS